MSYNPKLAPAIDKYADTNEFVKIELDNAYFEFSLKKASESKLWSKKILGTKSYREIIARYDLSRVAVYSDIPIV